MKIPQVQTQDRFLNQIQQNISSAIEPIFNELSGSFTIALTGCTTVPQDIAKWQRATATGPVTLLLPTLSGTSNSTSGFLTGLPTALWPQTTQAVFIQAQDAGTYSVGVAVINTDGTIQLVPVLGGSGFTASGTKSLLRGTITYATDV